MAFYFTCPYCFKKTLVDESLAGQAGPCAGCGKTVTVPSPPKQPEVARPVDSPHVSVQSDRANRNALALILNGLGLTVGIAIFSLLTVYLLWPTFQGLKTRRDKAACMNNLQRIAQALNEYALEYGTYPPPTVYAPDGTPMHSWRVLILEQLGETGLHRSYNFDEPWDSAQNAQLMARCPRVLISPAADGASIASESNYVLLTGKGTLFPKGGPLSPQNVPDGVENTLLVVETQNTKREWTRPGDIDISKLNPRIGSIGTDTIGGTHPGGATAVFADEQPAWLADDLAPELLNAIISPNGGEPIDPADYQLR